MILHSKVSDDFVRSQIRRAGILLAGNRRLKIFGKLNCASGKRMKRKNRIFFSSEDEAIENGFRPCGHCMRHEYKVWQNATTSR
jgi:methylphosphotriester-DNA--protein-cysteine methyltransferase